MSAEITDRQMTSENSLINQELYRVFVTESSEAIWRIELEKPVPTDLSTDEQIEHFYLYAYLAECNEAMARMYGYKASEEIIGARIGDLLVREDPNNVEYLRAFVTSNYRLENAESHEVDRDGNPKVFLNNLIGIVENGFVKRAWGTQRDITASRQAEESLRESQAILALSMQSSRMGVWTRDLATETVWWSEELEEIFGMEKGSFGGSEKDFFDFVYEDDREDLWGGIQQAIIGRREYSVEFRFRHADGTLRWMEGRGKAVYSEKGEPVRLYGIGIDITERKRSEEILRESEERHRTLLDSIDEGFCIFEMLFDESGKPSNYLFLEVNPAFEKLTGLENALGKTIREMVPDLEDSWFEIYGKVALTGEPIRFTEFSEVMDRWFDVYAVRVGGAESRKVGLIFKNITEQKKSEDKLRESEERFAKAFNSSPLVLTITSLKTGKLIEVNETFVSVTGFTREEATGRSTAELGLWVDDSDRETELRLFRQRAKFAIWNIFFAARTAE
jgi:PAS domain S-box-containing protein